MLVTVEIGYKIPGGCIILISYFCMILGNLVTKIFFHVNKNQFTKAANTGDDI